MIRALIACIGLVALGYYIRILHISIRQIKIEQMKKVKGITFNRIFNNVI